MKIIFVPTYVVTLSTVLCKVGLSATCADLELQRCVYFLANRYIVANGQQLRQVVSFNEYRMVQQQLPLTLKPRPSNFLQSSCQIIIQHGYDESFNFYKHFNQLLPSSLQQFVQINPHSVYIWKPIEGKWVTFIGGKFKVLHIQ